MAFEKISNSFSKFFAMDPDEDEEESQDMQQEPTGPAAKQPRAKSFRGNKVVSMNNPAEKTAKIVVFEPRIYSDAKEVGTHLLNNKAVVVNFDRIEPSDATRIVDFLTGTVFAISGEIRRVGEKIFLVTPANFQIDGTLAANLGIDDDLNVTDN